MPCPAAVSWLGFEAGLFFFRRYKSELVWVTISLDGGGTVTLELPQNFCFVSMGSGICKWLKPVPSCQSTIYPPSRKKRKKEKNLKLQSNRLEVLDPDTVPIAMSTSYVGAFVCFGFSTVNHRSRWGHRGFAGEGLNFKHPARHVMK